MRLLLLENRSAFAERLAAALSEGGQAQCECCSLSAFDRRVDHDGDISFDAIVLDLRRDARNSLNICRQVTQRSTNIPVIAVTAVDDHDEAVRIVQAGVEDVCLRDEFDADTLRDRIHCAIERHRISSLLASELHQPFLALDATDDSAFGRSASDGVFAAASQSTEDQVLQLACVIAPELESSSASKTTWNESLGITAEITQLDDLDALIEHVTAAPSDLVVVHVNNIDASVLDAIATVRAHREQTVIVVAAPNTDGETALKVIRHGADDFVASAGPVHETAARYLRQGLARRRRQAGEDQGASKTPNDTPRFEQRESHLEQHNPRYFITKSAIAIPIGLDLTPDMSVRAEGFTVDVSESGIGFEIADLGQLPSELLLAGIEGNDGLLYFATVEVRNWSPQRGRMHVGAQFVTGERDLLRPENLTPTYQPDTYGFAPQLPEDTLRKWVDLGIFRPVVVDRIYVCPTCGGMPTFRSGCRSCGSIHIASHQLIHHFKCSYLGKASEPQADGTVVCPKCGEVGSTESDDFELLNGPCRCMDCNWSDTNTEVVGRCMSCKWHFPLKSASERELIGYHVNRLDPQSLLGIS